ncbi:MAG: hypothetical protein E6Q97_15935 [Desulfurellales bacterium]|nr:MAG: hypothetical protein E6Q97_15935 [Desulfurellales bacterium]
MTTINTPHIVVHVPTRINGERTYILIESDDNNQEITIPTGWRLERDWRGALQRFWAVISAVWTDFSGKTVVIHLLEDSPTTTRVLPDWEVERWLN